MGKHQDGINQLLDDFDPSPWLALSVHQRTPLPDTEKADRRRRRPGCATAPPACAHIGKKNPPPVKEAEKYKRQRRVSLQPQQEQILGCNGVISKRLWALDCHNMKLRGGISRHAFPRRSFIAAERALVEGEGAHGLSEAVDLRRQSTSTMENR